MEGCAQRCSQGDASESVSEMKRRKLCHDCGCKEGELHECGCDMERCPFCGHQLITCECCYTALGYAIDRNKPLSGLPKKVYEEGLDAQEAAKWNRILQDKGRVPYIVFPNLCCRCGKLWPEMFRVPDEQWQRYVPIVERHRMLCRECYDDIKCLVDDAEARRQ